MKQKLETALVLVMGLSAGAANAQVCATQPTCESLGFMQKAADCSGKLLLKCPFDTTKVFCGGVACDSSYTLSSCDTSKGFCTSCGGKYKYITCNSGWYLSGGNCKENSCSGYSSSRGSDCTSFDTCMSGKTTKYRCNSCDSDCFYPVGGYCSEKPGFSFPFIPSNSTGYETCTYKGKTYYKSTGCKVGYTSECDGGVCRAPGEMGLCGESKEIW